MGQAINKPTYARLADIALVRAEMQFFPLTWTVVHRVTPDSALAALREIDAEGLAASGLRIMLSITSRDPALSAQVRASHAYGPDDIALDMRYADAVVGKGDNHSVADMRKISDVEANA